jgi:hypothetical protein
VPCCGDWSTYGWALLLSIYYLFTVLKQVLDGRKDKDSVKVEAVVTQWLIKWETVWYQQDTEKVIHQYEKCFICGHGHVDK